MATMLAAVLRQDQGRDRYEHELGVAHPRVLSPLVRPFPNEQIYFWRKVVDNSRVARQGDPRIWEACWRFFSATSLIVALVIGLLVPNALNLLMGIQLRRLRHEQAELLSEKRQLALEESRLRSPERLQRLADKFGMKDAGSLNAVRLQRDNSQATASRQRTNPARR